MAESNNEKRIHGIVAEYSTVDSLLAACRRVRDAGYTKTDAFAPFPIHGIDTALGIKPTGLPWIALVAGLTGTGIAFLMQIWMNGIDYPYIISGKPFISTPAFVPVAFELTILLASFGTFFGMWALNRLPRFSNPMFTNPRFDRASDDTFFLYIDANDDRYDQAGVEQLLADAGGEHIVQVVDDDSPTQIPRFLLIGLATIIALSMIPALVVAKMRVTQSSSPRFHIFFDMDFSPAKDAQQISTLFRDLRAARPDVPGTVARGADEADLDFLTGVDVEALAATDAPRAERLVTRFADPQQQADQADASPAAATDVEPEPAQEPVAAEPTPEEPVAAEPMPEEPTPGGQVEDTTPWLERIPLEMSSELLHRGREKFEIYCAVCHGIDGRGNGLVNQRAQQILAATWTPPSNILTENLHQESYPDGKLFSTISNGIRKMSGYASQMEAKDRWAVVAYVRALQRSQNAELDLVPEELRESIAMTKAEVDRQLEEAEQAERDRQAAAEQEKQE